MIDEKALEAALVAFANETGLPRDKNEDELIRIAILAYESAKPREAEGLKLGSRLTVEGVEAVVMPAKLLREYRPSMTEDVVHSWAAEVRAMLSAG